jgi:L-lactate utilization protein LutB
MKIGGITMDNNLKSIYAHKITKTLANLKKNNIDGHYVEDEEQLVAKLKEILEDNWTVAVGGSMTLFETGIIDYIRGGNYNFLDRYAEGLKPEDIKEVYRKSFFADAYITSTNALLEEGYLYNVDSTGNRVAAMLYGPDNVIVIAGINKLVGTVEQAVERNKNIAAPANCTRLNRRTPCTKTGQCMDCSSVDRICNDYVLIKRQNIPGRIKVIIVGKSLGY